MKAMNREPGKRDTRHNGVDIIGSILTWFNTRNESVVTFHILSHLCRIDSNGSVEIRKRNHEDDVNEIVQQALGIHKTLSTGLALSVEYWTIANGMNIRA